MLNGTDVIQVRVRKEDGLDAILATAQTRCVRDQVVDAEHVLVRKLKSQVDDVDIAIDFDDEAVAADLFEPAEWVDAQSGASTVLVWGSTLRVWA